MPQRTCCVSSCKSSLLEDAVLHAFPNPSTEYEKFHTWVTNAGLVGEDYNYVFKNRRICHLHFEEIFHYPKNRLSRTAIPTLQLEASSDIKSEDEDDDNYGKQNTTAATPITRVTPKRRKDDYTKRMTVSVSQ